MRNSNWMDVVSVDDPSQSNYPSGGGSRMDVVHVDDISQPSDPAGGGIPTTSSRYQKRFCIKPKSPRVPLNEEIPSNIAILRGSFFSVCEPRRVIWGVSPLICISLRRLSGGTDAFSTSMCRFPC